MLAYPSLHLGRPYRWCTKTQYTNKEKTLKNGKWKTTTQNLAWESNAWASSFSSVALCNKCICIKIFECIRFLPSQHLTSRNLSGSCFFYEDGFCVFLPLTGLYLAGMVMMASRLRHTNDAFRIKNEMCFICASTAITTGEGRSTWTCGWTAALSFSRFLKHPWCRYIYRRMYPKHVRSA